MKLVFLGPPGAGKGTQAAMLSARMGIPHISTGDIFRENMKNKTELGIKAKEIVDSGNLVPDDITNAMVKDRLEKQDCSKGYILDGYPRTIPQAEYLDSIQKIERAVYFELEGDEAVRRLLGRAAKEGRKDDTPEVIKNRLEVYKKQTQPLIDFYKKKGILVNINAGPGIEEISSRVIAALSK